MSVEMLPPTPGLNRAARRRLARSVGDRGTKAQRKGAGGAHHLGPPPPEVKDAMIRQLNEEREAQEDHVKRARLRQSGLTVPPSEAEQAVLRQQQLGQQAAMGQRPSGLLVVE